MSDYMNNNNMCMDWDDAIENDGQEFIVLDEGDYNFTVTEFERGRFPGSAKIPACNKATLTLEVMTEKGPAYVKTDIILYRSLEWRISSFFRSIGQKKHGEKLVMNWNLVKGSRGRAHIKPRTYIGTDGQEHKTNDVANFIDYDEKNFPPATNFVEVGEDDELPFN